MTSFSVGTFNIGNGTGADLMKVAAPADVVCCQEASDRSAMINAFTLQNPDWISFRGDVTGGPAVPVLLDTAALGVPVAFEAVPAVGARQLGTNGTPPAKSKPKVITHVTLANGVHLLNTHFIPSATRTKAFLGAAEWKARRDHYRDHVAAIVTLVGTLDGPVILTMDANATPEFELLQPLHDLGFTGWTTEGTHGARAIDHVLFLPNRGLTWTAHAVIPTASDHDAVVSTFDLEPPVPDPYAHSTYHDKPLDNATIDAIKAAEGILQYPGGLTIVQGIGGAPASAGTHLEGRVVDFVDWDTDRKLRVLKDLGFAIWRRPTIPGLWNAHIHGCLILETRSNPRGIAASALRQIESFDRGRNGLADDGPDNTYRPDPKVNFHYPYEAPVPLPPVTKVSKARDQIVEAIHAVGLASALLGDAAEKRAPMRKAAADLDATETGLRKLLKDMPET